MSFNVLMFALLAALTLQTQLAELKPVNQARPAAFTVMGDSRGEWRFPFRYFYPPNDVFERLLAAANLLEADFTMHLGDIVMTGSGAEYQALEQFLDKMKLRRPFFVAIGNHEVHDKAGLENYRSVFGAPYYFFDHKGFRFIVVDSSRRRLGGEQLKWLKSALETKLRKLVFTHMPPAPLQGWDDSPWKHWLGSRTNGVLRDDGTFTNLMRDAKVERVYAGHVHGFGQADYKGVRYVLSGGAGSPFYPWHIAKFRFYHSIKVKLAQDGSIQEEVCPLDEACRPISQYPVFPESLFGS